MKIIVSGHFFPLLKNRSRYLIMGGGAGSGKSEFAARKIFYRCEKEGHHRIAIVRKVRKTLRESCVKVVLTVLDENGISYTFNRTDLVITFGTNEILFVGLDDPEKIKSIKGLTSIWLEEATEFLRDDFLQLDMRLREPGPNYQQIMMTFNPDESKAEWIKERFYGAIPDKNATVHGSTVEDNPIAAVREQYIKILEGLKLQDPRMYEIYRLGLWASRSGVIFNWDVVPLPTDIAFDEIWCGGDFGYSVDPAAAVRIYRRADEFWLEEMLYDTELTNNALSAKLKASGIGDSVSYWDSAEPKSIEELRQNGIYAQPAAKGPDSARAGIDFLKSRKIHIVEGSVNLVNEVSSYCWRKDRSTGREMPEPVKFKDHLMDAVRYGICTHLNIAMPMIGSLA